jgi:serine/threonine protein kinase
MFLKETITYLKRRRKRTYRRSLARKLYLLAGTNRLPRFRVARPDNAQDLLVGMTLASKYYVLSVLGYGGMSVVYKGKQLGKNRIVAVKTLRVQGLSDERTVKRFQREAELLSHLNHPRIVQVSHYGTTVRGQPYFVMDYLTGVNLSDLLKQHGALPAVRVKDIFSQVCGAVDHAHRCGVVHRDLKPGNIMLIGRDENGDMVKVVDFGIARFEEEAQRLTRMGEVWGSPIYMSPEQCTGSQLDARSDIYSVGICMYEALTGRVPYLGKNYVETMSLQIMADPKPFTQVCPGVLFPPDLERVVRKTLEKEPERRYQTMGELRADLEQALSLVDGGRKRASSSLVQMPKVQPPKPAGARLTGTQLPGPAQGNKIPPVNKVGAGPKISQSKVPAASMTPRASQTRVPPSRQPIANVSQQRLSALNKPEYLKSLAGALMPNFARVCIILAVVALIALASQIIGDYVKANPEWAKYLNSDPNFSPPAESPAPDKDAVEKSEKSEKGERESSDTDSEKTAPAQ